MWSQSWLARLRRSAGWTSLPRTKSRRKQGYSPCLEALETRTLLTAGFLDLPFGTAGKVVTDFGGTDIAYATAVQPWDDKILVAGYSSSVGTGTNFALARYNPDGKLDKTFGVGGKVTTDFDGGLDAAGAVAVEKFDQKIIVAGTAVVAGVPEFALARYNSDGSLDKNFGAGGKVTTKVSTADALSVEGIYAIHVSDFGKILAVGQAGSDMALVQYRVNGGVDLLFGNNGIVLDSFADPSQANAVAVDKNGAIVVAGSVGSELAVARFDAQGVADAQFGTSGVVLTQLISGNFERGAGVAIQDNGRIVVSGTSGMFSPDVGQPFLARFLPDGAPDSDFNGTGTEFFTSPASSFNAVAIQNDGKIIAAGGSVGFTYFTLVRCNPDGSLDTGFAHLGVATTAFGDSASVHAIALQADGKIIAAGATATNNNVDFAIARYDAPFNTIDISKVAGLLTIQGTKFDDAITVTADARGVTVASLREDTAPLTIAGIDQVMVNTGDGNDAVNVQISDVSLRFLAVSVDLGSGDDRFTAAFPGSERPAVGDLVTLPPVDLSVQGGDGKDDIRVIYGFNPQPDPPALPSVYLNTPVNASLNGGRGNDDIRVIFGFNPQPDPPAKLFVNAAINVQAEGGQGNDDIRVIYGFNPQPDPPADPAMVLNAPLGLTLSGGQGDDDIRVISSFNPQPDPPAHPILVLNSSMQVQIDGGAGNDTIVGEFLPSFHSGGSLHVVLDGGAGDDVIMALLGMNPTDSLGVGDVYLHALGGAGDDRLSMLVNASPASRRSADLLVDGGSGFDIGVVTANVLVRNVERVTVASPRG